MSLEIDDENTDEEKNFRYQHQHVIVIVGVWVSLHQAEPYEHTCYHEYDAYDQIKLQETLA